MAEKAMKIALNCASIVRLGYILVGVTVIEGLMTTMGRH
jgi:hypothetical protein